MAYKQVPSCKNELRSKQDTEESLPWLCWLKAWSDPRKVKCYACFIKGQKAGQDFQELQKSAPTMAAM